MIIKGKYTSKNRSPLTILNRSTNELTLYKFTKFYTAFNLAIFIVLESERIDFKSTQEQLENTIEELEVTIVEEQQRQIELYTISRKPKSGWEEYFPTHDSTTLVGSSFNEIRNLLGEPPFLVRSTNIIPEYNREIWVYIPYDEDPTGLYLYFESGSLIRSKLDEFVGFIEPYWE